MTLKVTVIKYCLLQGEVLQWNEKRKTPSDEEVGLQ